MRSVYDFLGPAIFDVIIEGYSAFVGRPLQRLRAKRLARRGKIRSVLFDPENPRVLPTRLLFGAAEVCERRIQLFDADLWVQGVEGPPVHGPARERSDGDLIFRPKTLIYTLRTHRGTVKWTVLEWQAEHALTLLGFPASTE
jgi:hypothetical protein